ncbi:MAG: ATPase [Chloroflexi bacterium]|nr:MAG: ATPase [Chloroflexota bacterium]RLI53973.1 MAG: ATPase [Candidatus Thorarchaeota archaeon]
MSSNNISQLFDRAERIGVIGSPSSTTELALDILAGAVTKKLVGELALFRYFQDTHDHYALGQITEVTLRNVWHEDPTMRSLIRQRGRVDAVSERQDTHQGEMVVSAVFSDENAGYRPSSLGTVPATGTPIALVEDSVLDELLSPYKSQLFYLGHVYGSQPRLPLWFKHFDSGPSGAGEAYHIGIFGKTGSGKSVLAQMILLGYAQHPKLGLFVFDPQGEFSLALNNPQSRLSMGRILAPSILDGLGRKFQVFDLSRFRLGTWELFGELLSEFGFFSTLGIKNTQYQSTTADYVVDFLRGEKKHKLDSLDDSAFVEALDHIGENIHRIYAGAGGQDRVKSFIGEAKLKLDNGQSTRLKEEWNRTVSLFSAGNNKVSIDNIIQQALAPSKVGARSLIVVDLSSPPQGISHGVWDEHIKPLLIDSFLSVLIRKAEKAYQNEKSLNTLVVLDEASRLARGGKAENERKQRIKTRLVDAVRTTRKYGLGWMFLSQTLSSLDSEIIQQLRISFFGFGLSMGAEFSKLRELVGGEGKHLKLYQKFRDPQSAFDTNSREYSFMTIGPVSPLSFSGTPLFFNAFNQPEDFLETNGLLAQQRLL